MSTINDILESHFGGKSGSSNGGETVAYCTKCRADTQHIILESYGEEIRRVQCSVCGDMHAFKPPRGGDDDNPEPLVATKKRGQRKVKWLEGISNADRGNAARYSPKTEFAVGQLVVHPHFGVGFVSDLTGDRKVEVMFRNDLARVLVHGRGENEEELRGDRVPEEEVGQLLGIEMGPSPEEIAEERERKLAAEEAEKQRIAEEKRLAAERERQAAIERREAERRAREEERERKRKEREEERERKRKEKEVERQRRAEERRLEQERRRAEAARKREEEKQRREEERERKRKEREEERERKRKEKEAERKRKAAEREKEKLAKQKEREKEKLAKECEKECLAKEK